jgi:hypothetical protein
MKNDPRHAIVLAMVALVTAVGCENKDANLPLRVPVSGVVTFENQPLANATVIFYPTSHEHTATAMTDENGRYELQTFRPGDGAVPGQFSVTVRKVEVKAGRTSGGDETNDDGGDTGGEGGPPAVERSLIPAKYGSIGTSMLKADVAETGENVFPFTL